MTLDRATEARLCLPPVPVSASPSRRLPDGTCDCHVHVFGPRDRYPLVDNRSYTPHHSTFDDYRKMMDILGITRAVLIQPSVYGTDNRAMLHVLAENQDCLRGVVVVPPTISRGELVAMHRLGVRGVRINSRNPCGLDPREMPSIGRRIASLNWHIQLQVDLSALQDLETLIRSTPVSVVIDHLGFPNVREGVSSPSFRHLLRLVLEGSVWVKISGQYRSSRSCFPYHDLIPYTDALLSTRPDRILWATDWPHPEIWGEMPDDVGLLENSRVWNCSVETRTSVLVKNPNYLYWNK